MNLLSAVLLALVEQLGSVNWPEREEAHRVLTALVPVSLPAAKHAVSHSDPEVRRRALSILEDAHRFGPCPLPWVDMLAPEFPDRHAVINRCLERSGWLNSGGYGAPDWPHWRQATLHLVADLLAEGWTRERVEALLSRMAEAERDYRRKHKFEPIWQPFP